MTERSARTPSNLHVSFGQQVIDSALRQRLERSVIAHVARQMAEIDDVRAEEFARAKLHAAIGAPVRRLIEQDPEAVKAIEELRARRLRDIQSALSMRERILTPQATEVGARRDRQDVRPLVLAAAPPYEVNWTWFHEEGDEPSLLHLDAQTGEIKIIGATGNAGFVAANAGFGLVISPSHDLTAWFTQLRYSGHYSLNIPVVGDVATARASMKYRVTENETDVVSPNFGEVYNVSFSGSGPFSSVSDSVPERFGTVTVPTQLQPGHEYTLIVDIDIYAEALSGGGTADALAECTAQVTAIGHS